MYRPYKIFLALVLAIALLVDFTPLPSGSGLFAISQASAQKKKRKSLFSILFGSRSVKRKTVRRKLKRKTVRRRVKSRKKRSRASAKRKPVKRIVRRKAKTKRARRAKLRSTTASRAVTGPLVIEKLENAKRVVVIGDFIGGGLASGLDTALETNSTVDVINRTKSSSGLVRSDIVNWPEQVPEMVKRDKPSYIVNLIGTNDRQLLRKDGKRLKKRTPEWDTEYKARIKGLATSLQQTGVPFVWVGLPPVRFRSMNTDFLVFNEWYRQAATSAGGKFIDVWDGFADAEGAYARSGPDVNGQIVLLRRKDGINLTPAGRRRLAFYVEGEISKLLSGSLEFATRDDLTGISIEAAEEDRYNPAKSGKTVVIRLDDPASDGADKLAGEVINLSQQVGVSSAVPASASTRARSTNSLRADNFAWPPTGSVPVARSAVARSN